MNADEIIKALLGLGMVGLTFYLRTINESIKELRDTLTTWQQRVLTDCIGRREFDKHIADYEKYKADYVSKNMHDIRNHLNRFQALLGRRHVPEGEEEQ